MIWIILGVIVGLSLILGFIFDVKFNAKKLTREERKKKGNLVINGKRIF